VASGIAIDVVLQVFERDLASRLDRYLATGRGKLVTAFNRWSEKYHIPLSQLEAERDAATRKLAVYLAELGYA
jgi:type I restriction enzyme M protein